MYNYSVHACSYSESSRRIGLHVAFPDILHPRCMRYYYNASYVHRALLSALVGLVVGDPVYTYSINVPQFALKQLWLIFDYPNSLLI